MLIFRGSRSQMFFKIGVLKNVAILESFLNNDSKIPFSTKSGMYWRKSHRFLSRTPLKTRAKPQKQSLQQFCKKKVVLRNFAHFIGKNLPWSLFLTELQAFRDATLWKRDSNTDIFLWSFGTFKNWSLRATVSETCSFTWSVLLNKLHFWLKLVHML